MSKNILITGGAGFIGINSARHFIKQGWNATILDNFSRRGTEINLEWLNRDFPDKIKVVRADISKDASVLGELAEANDFILHLAGQVAVTTSIADPLKDFNSNALGTLNILEAIRQSKRRPAIIYASTNKVYGSLGGVPVDELKERYAFANEPYRSHGVPETQNLDFHSPYGCSKGVADQYVLDYSRIFGLKAVVLRQSCIYGIHQLGVEDQGWVAWFLIAALLGLPLTLYGNGKQVRDLLYIDDLTDLYEKVFKNIDKGNGQAFNVGGGTKNSLSLLELLEKMNHELGLPSKFSIEDNRAGDQPIFIADTRKVREIFSWAPQVSVMEGLPKLSNWLSENKETIKTFLKN